MKNIIKYTMFHTCDDLVQWQKELYGKIKIIHINPVFNDFNMSFTGDKNPEEITEANAKPSFSVFVTYVEDEEDKETMKENK